MLVGMLVHSKHRDELFKLEKQQLQEVMEGTRPEI